MPKRPAKGSVRWVNVAQIIRDQTEREVEAVGLGLASMTDPQLTPEQVSDRTERFRAETERQRAGRVADFARSWFGTKFVGPKTADAWARTTKLLQQEDTLRRADARKGRRKDDVPELWRDTLTPEGEDAQAAFLKAVLREGFGGYVEQEMEPTEAAGTWDVAWEELEYLEQAERVALMREVVASQRLSAIDFFRSANSGDAGSE